jgi:hypothetical protein
MAFAHPASPLSQPCGTHTPFACLWHLREASKHPHISHLQSSQSASGLPASCRQATFTSQISTSYSKRIVAGDFISRNSTGYVAHAQRYRSKQCTNAQILHQINHRRNRKRKKQRELDITFAIPTKFLTKAEKNQEGKGKVHQRLSKRVSVLSIDHISTPLFPWCR